MIKEIWKPIEGYPDYEVSNLGRIKSLNYNRTGKEKIMKLQSGKNGYQIIHLCKNGIHYNFKIHRLVALAFLPNPNNLPCINHINENKTDNRVENLEWCTHKYNMNFGTILQRKSIKQSKPILQLNNYGELVKKWNGAREVQRKTIFNQGNISRCCKGNSKTAYGYKWGYADDYERIPFRVFDLEIYRKKIS